MRIYTILLLAAFSTKLFANLPPDSVVGKWVSMDEETNKPNSVLELYKEANGEIAGKIVKLFRKADEDQNPLCEKCSDYRKSQPILGMQIVSGMKFIGPKWEKGTILDPKAGKIYRGSLWAELKDQKPVLKMRGYIAFFFRTKDWLPYNSLEHGADQKTSPQPTKETRPLLKPTQPASAPTTPQGSAEQKL